MATLANRRNIRAPRGNTLNTRSWQTEGALRMLMNNLDPDVAERPEDLIVYGGSGKAARNWDSYEKIIEVLKTLNNDETLLIQSGKPVGVIQTHAEAPRVLMANSNLVGRWATWDHFNELDKKGLMMYGQMTAGSWSYIGSQGILGGTFETFSEAGRIHYGGDVAGRWLLTAGLGGMGGAQPLAGVVAGYSVLAVECRRDRIERRIQTGYLERVTDSLDEAIAILTEAKKTKKPTSIGLVGNAAEVYEELLKRNVLPDLVTDQTSAHDAVKGYLPAGMSVAEWEKKSESDPKGVAEAAKKTMARQVRAMLEFKKRGIPVFDYGNNIRQGAKDAGVEDAFDFPGFISAYIRPQFCRGRAQFRWIALSGDPKDLEITSQRLAETVGRADPKFQAWIEMVSKRVQIQGLPARSFWLGRQDRVNAGLVINDLVREGKVSAPMVIGRDHISSGSVASPNRESEGMRDGSDAVSDWALLNALASCASGATWVAIHQGGGTGMGFSQHAGLAVVCDGTEEAARRVRRVFANDSAIAIFRHADAGYEEAVECAREEGLKSPFINPKAA